MLLNIDKMKNKLKPICDKVKAAVKKFLNGVLKAFCEFNDSW